MYHRSSPDPTGVARRVRGRYTTFAGNTYCGINTCPTRPVVQLCGVRFAGCYEQSSMASESSAVSQRFPSAPSLQLPSGQEVSEILQQTCAEVSQTTTAEIVEVANSAAPRSKLQDLLPVYFYSWQLQSPEAVIIYLLLTYFIMWRDGSERREVKEAFEEYIERLKSRVAELEKNLYESRTEVHQMKAELEERREPDSEIMRPMKQVQGWRPEHGKLQCAHEVSVSVCLSFFYL